ncbi:MAG: hypothetical protein ACR2IE_04250 [Candidatus Sumerlaeaceae bacterium]
MKKQARNSRSRPEERAKLRDLLERFGSLLTDRQTAMVRGYAVDNQSFSEIARQQGVSRQAVHEAVRAAERVLTEYESKLGHLATPPAGTNFAMGAADLNQVFSKLESLKMKIARTGIIYSVDWIRREIDSVMDLLADQQREAKSQQQPVVAQMLVSVPEPELVGASQTA